MSSDLTVRRSDVFMYVAMTSTAWRPRGVPTSTEVAGTEYDTGSFSPCSAGDDRAVSVDATDVLREAELAAVSKLKTALTLSRYRTAGSDGDARSSSPRPSSPRPSSSSRSSSPTGRSSESAPTPCASASRCLRSSSASISVVMVRSRSLPARASSTISSGCRQRGARAAHASGGAAGGCCRQKKACPMVLLGCAVPLAARPLARERIGNYRRRAWKKAALPPASAGWEEGGRGGRRAAVGGRRPT